MSLHIKIDKVLEKAETELLDLVSIAAKVADYDGIDMAHQAASYIREARGRLQKDGEAPPRAGGVGSESVESLGTAGRRARGKESYPRFTVEGSTLIKTGWSKKKREEYSQRVPGEVFDRVVRALSSVGGNVGAVKSETILEALVSNDGEVPSYQAYAVIGFLRQSGVLRQVNRGEYSIPTNVAAAAANAWDRRGA